MPTDTKPPQPAATTGLVPRYRLWLHLGAMGLVVMTFVLVAVGGNVTSLDAGMAVPKGWTTFGYFNFLAPLEVWWHDMGTRWEHSHRLLGTVVGLWTIGLVVSLIATQWKCRPWLMWLGVLLFLMVVAQGVMGAARVDLVSTQLALVHGVFGQIVLATTVIIAAATSKVWINLAGRRLKADTADGLRKWTVLFVALLVIQLVLGAAVRHSRATLAIPDFPTSYGHIFPPLTQPEIDKAFREMPLQVNAVPATVGQVATHFAHRVMAGVVTVAAVVLVFWIVGKLSSRKEVVGPVFVVVSLLVLQWLLGVSVIWSEGYPSIATYHQACGAALLASAVWLAIRIHLVTSNKRQRSHGSSRIYVAPAAGNLRGGAT